ncbi:TonB-dependent siderophore receptor [Rhodobacteraceae bacterium]|nr:TonB-dependent siderophore receptor [Paracoccaceae bacterium]
MPALAHRPLTCLTIALCTTGLTPAFAQDAAPFKLEEIVVEAESDETLAQNGYVASYGRQATKLDTDIARIPQSVSVVTQDQMEDQDPRTLLEALNYTAGVNTTNFAFDTRYDAVYLRGFAAYTNGFFRDGLRQVNGPSAWYRNDPYTIEGVAVLKGPASSLYGVSGPGGVVNVVSKRPKADAFRELRVTGGTDDHKELAFDVTGEGSQDGRFLYRLTGIWRDADTPLAGYKDDTKLIAPSFTYKFDDRTKITVLSEYAKSTVGGTASYYNPSYGVASTLYNGDPDYNDFTNEQYRIGYELEHMLSDTITLRQKLRYSHVDSDLEYAGYYAQSAGSLARYWGHYREEQHNLSIDNTAEFSFATGRFDHNLVVGVDYTDSSYDAYLAPTGYVSAAATDAAGLPYYAGQDVEQTGVYIHDQITDGRMNLFLSARHDWVDTTTEDGARTRQDSHDQHWSGRVGVSYSMENGLTPFANLSSAFVPNTGLVFDPSDPSSGRAAQATTALQKEIGLKYQIPGSESLITASLFDIKQEDGVVYQTVDASLFGVNQVQVPYDLHSRGLELEGQMNLGTDWRMLGNYTYTDMEIEKGTAGTIGRQLSATPRHSAALWAFYAPQTGPMAGWGLGGGLRYVGESYGDDTNSFKNDDYIFADMSLSYDFAALGQDGLKMQMNVKNLFDEKGQTCSAGTCYRYEGRTATVSLDYRF